MSRSFWGADLESRKRGSHWFSIGTGPMFHDFFRKGRNSASASAGDSNAASPLSLPLAIEAGFAFSELFKVAPTLLYTPIARNSAGGDTQVKHLFLTPKLVYQFTRLPTQLHFGPGVWITTTKGKGDRVLVQNGSGQMYFGSPGDSKSTRQAYLMLGVTQSIKKFHIDLDFYFPGIMSGRRMMNMVVGLGYDVL